MEDTEYVINSGGGRRRRRRREERGGEKGLELKSYSRRSQR